MHENLTARWCSDVNIFGKPDYSVSAAEANDSPRLINTYAPRTIRKHTAECNHLVKEINTLG